MYEQNINAQNYLKVLEEAIEDMKELRDISRDVLFLQIDNARYHWLHALKNLTFQFTPVTHMVYLEIQLLEVNFSMAKSK